MRWLNPMTVLYSMWRPYSQQHSWILKIIFQWMLTVYLFINLCCRILLYNVCCDIIWGTLRFIVPSTYSFGWSLEKVLKEGNSIPRIVPYIEISTGTNCVIKTNLTKIVWAKSWFKLLCDLMMIYWYYFKLVILRFTDFFIESELLLKGKKIICL